MPCGPQGLLTDGPSSNTTHSTVHWLGPIDRYSQSTQPFPRYLLFWGVKCLSHRPTFHPSALERTFSHTPPPPPPPHPCELLSHRLAVASSPLLPSDLRVRDSLGCFGASMSLASSHPETLRAALLSRKFSVGLWLSEWAPSHSQAFEEINPSTFPVPGPVL